MKGKARTRVSLALGLVALLGLALATAYVSVLRPRLMNRYALLAAVRPVHLANCTLERFGHPHDGGYLMCANLMDQAKVAYSYGIDDRDEWGCDVSRQDHIAVHEYDCFDTRQPVCERGQFIFHPECVGPKAEVIDKRVFDSVTDQITRNGDHGKRLIVKMDVEGAEWDSLQATSNEVLATMDQLVLEFHHVDGPGFVQVIEKLKKTFYVANVHFNNHACGLEWWPFPSWAFEVLLVSRRLGKPDQGVWRPSPKEAVNDTSRHDCQAHWD
jgi:hypothetical protein